MPSCLLPTAWRPSRCWTGVEYVNDSKATNVDAVRRALECFGSPVVLIMGGVDKGGNFGRLTEAVRPPRPGSGPPGRRSPTPSARHSAGLLPTCEASSMREAGANGAGGWPRPGDVGAARPRAAPASICT